MTLLALRLCKLCAQIDIAIEPLQLSVRQLAGLALQRQLRGVVFVPLFEPDIVGPEEVAFALQAYHEGDHSAALYYLERLQKLFVNPDDKPLKPN